MVGGLDELRAQLIGAREREGLRARQRRQLLVALALACAAAACDNSADAAAERAKAAVAAPVDSILPMDDAIRRFRAGLPAVQQLSGGASSRDELVASFVRAVELNDTAAIRLAHVSRAEYAYLYFPSSIYMSEPYRQPPAVAWFLNSENSDKGISRVLRRLGGRELAWSGYSCSDQAREGDNSFFRSCVLDYLDPAERTRVTRRLFGTIIERDGQYKFLSYANDL